MNTPFARVWLDTDTVFAGMTPAQYKRLRAMCEKFFVAGIAAARCNNTLPKTSINKPTEGTTQGATP